MVSHIRQWLKTGLFASSAMVTLPMYYQAHTLVVDWQVHESLPFDTMPI
jgi:hypothetical protein